MTTRSQATAAPIPVTIGDLRLELSPLTDRMEAELDNWVRARIINAARAAVAQDPELPGGPQLVQDAVARAASAQWDDAQGAQLVNTLDGWSQVFWQATRRNTPGVTPADVLRAIRADPEGFQTAVLVWLDLNGRRAARREDPEKNAMHRQRRRRHRARNKNRTWGRSTAP